MNAKAVFARMIGNDVGFEKPNSVWKPVSKCDKVEKIEGGSLEEVSVIQSRQSDHESLKFLNLMVTITNLFSLVSAKTVRLSPRPSCSLRKVTGSSMHLFTISSLQVQTPKYAPGGTLHTFEWLDYSCGLASCTAKARRA